MAGVELRTISKSYGSTKVLHDVSLELRPGEVLALLGENGAGKSSLLKILSGIVAPDSGEIAVEGQTQRFASLRDARGCGIVLLHQELNLLSNLSIADNLALGLERSPCARIDKRAEEERARELLSLVGLRLSSDRLVSSLTTGQQQQVEIARALGTNARYLLMDEPTASLSSRECEILFTLIEQLTAQGVGVMYVSHRLDEVSAIADRAVVLRDGHKVTELEGDTLRRDEMIRHMVGRDITSSHHLTCGKIGDELLSVESFISDTFPSAVSFSLRAGEIVGIAGLVGAGRTELVESIIGLRSARGGVVRVRGLPRVIRTASDAVDAGIGFVPEDRKEAGLFLSHSISDNISIRSLANHSTFGVLNRRWERDLVERVVQRLSVRGPDQSSPVQTLSGGNQQKVLLGRWVASDPLVLILDEPTRGVDVGARADIYTELRRLAGEGRAVLFVSSDLEEILELSDRVLVMCEGRLTGDLSRAELSEEAVMQRAMGQVQ